MTLKINKVLEVKADYNGTSKSSGNPYTIKSVYAEINLDGKQFSALVKSFGNENILTDGAEFTNVEAKEYNGSTSYTVKAGGAPSGGGGYNKREVPKTTWPDFVKRVDACMQKVVGLSVDTESKLKMFEVLLTNSWTVDPATIPTAFSEKDKKEGPDPDQIPF